MPSHASSAPEPPAVGRGISASSVARGLRNPVVLAFLLAAFFDLISGNPLAHGLALVLVAVALVVDASRSSKRPERTGEPRVRLPSSMTPSALICVIAYGALAGGFARYSWPATLAVVVPGGVAVVIAWRAGPGEPPPPLGRAGVLAWAGVAVAFAIWELTNLFLQPTLTISSSAHPTLSTLMDPLLASHLRRSVFLGGWVTAGARLLRR